MHWDDKHDWMCISRSVSSLLMACTTFGWNKLPFTDSPDAQTLQKVCASLAPGKPNPKVTPVPFHRSTDKAGPSSMEVDSDVTPAPPFPTAGHTSGNVTPRPLKPKPAVPQQTRPPTLKVWPSKPAPPFPKVPTKHSFADAVKDANLLVRLTWTMPDLEPEHIVTMHLASLPTASGWRKVNSTTTGPSHHQILVPLDPLPPVSMISTLILASNHALANLNLRVESAHFAYKGIALATNAVVSVSNLEMVSMAISCALGRSTPTPASLP
jgi:hypothetical protein